MTARDAAVVYLGNEVFKIPTEYLSSNKNFPDEIRKEDTVTITLFLPDFSGLGDGKKLAGIGPYNPDRITAFWTMPAAGRSLDANRRLRSAFEFGLLERDETLDTAVATGYRDPKDGGVAIIGPNVRGDDVLVQCSDGLVNSLCQFHFVDSQSNRGVVASFDRGRFAEWSDINEHLLLLIDQWKEQTTRTK